MWSVRPLSESPGIIVHFQGIQIDWCIINIKFINPIHECSSSHILLHQVIIPNMGAFTIYGFEGIAYACS